MSANEFYTNSDGLNIRFGLEKGSPAKEGVISTMGDESVLKVKVVGVDLASSGAPLATHPLAGIPTGAHLISARLYVTEAFTSGGSGTLTLGLYHDDGDGTFSVIDEDGIDATIAKTALDAVSPSPRYWYCSYCRHWWTPSVCLRSLCYSSLHGW